MLRDPPRKRGTSIDEIDLDARAPEHLTEEEWKDQHPEVWRDALAIARDRGARAPNRYALKVAPGLLTDGLERTEAAEAIKATRAAIGACRRCYSTGWRYGTGGMVRCDHTAGPRIASGVSA